MFKPPEGPVMLLVASLQVSKNHGLLKVLRTVFSAMSFKMEMNEDMGPSASVMVIGAGECCTYVEIVPNLPPST